LSAQPGMAGELRAMRRQLGQELKAARKIGYTRSGVSNAESGGCARRMFWERCDTVLRTGGTLAPGYDKIQQRSAAELESRAMADAGDEPGIKVAVGYSRGTWRIEICLPPEKREPS
jgi:hypothetical protein